jgi:peptide/nickel transport system substrate-binding protein
MRRTRAAGVAVLCLLMAVAAACSTTGTKPTQTDSNNTGENINAAGTPVRGGTLHMLGVGDVDYMDPNISYYSGGYLALRLWSRQLVTYPGVAGKATTDVPDLATTMPTEGNGGISKDGLTWKLTIRSGAMWNTSPARQVTAADEVRGVKRTCNPAQPFGGMPDFQDLIVGLADYCDGFSKVDAKSASAIAGYQNSHDIAGVSVDPTNPLTVVFKLTHPATYFLPMLALPAFSPSPVEYDQYIPTSAELAQHTISDGPYYITKYNPTKEIDFARNPAWKASTDDVRKAYVDAVVVNETGNQDAIQQQLQANTADADMEWDTFPPVSAVPQLSASKDPSFYAGPTFSSNPYLIFNIASPNNGGALSNVAVRQALSEAISRDHLVQDANGPVISPPLTHVLPAGISGTSSNTSIDLYKYDPTQAKKDLATAGFPNGFTLKFLYRPASSLSSKIFTTLQQDLGAIGVHLDGVGVPNADFYTKYLQVPSAAKQGVWDLSLAGWGSDWYGDAAVSWFTPLFWGNDGKSGSAYPPNGSDFGFYNSAKVNDLITQASTQTDTAKASELWIEADKQIMQDAAFFPITANNQVTYHSSHVHNTVFVPTFQQIDPANVWLTSN